MRHLFVLLLTVCLTTVSAVGQEKTWYTGLKTQKGELQAHDLQIRSLQISKLPRDTFGHGKPPFGNSFVDSWVVGSGTGLYGTFRLELSGRLVYQEELSSIGKFVDDRDRDLTASPDGEEINSFFPLNKQLQVQVSSDQDKVLFTLRGYRTPTPGATRLAAEADPVFLSFSEEKSQTVEVKFASGEEITAGPVQFKIYKAAELPTLRERRTRNEFGKPNEWGIRMAAREKPLKRIELLDKDGNVVKRSTGTAFQGRSFTWYVESLDAEPASVRVTWYEAWELVTVPLNILTPLGI